MKVKDIISITPIKRVVLGTGLFIGALIIGKTLYSYSIYSNLKYVRKQLENINFDEEI